MASMRTRPIDPCVCNVRVLLDSQVQSLVLPENTTHILQPLDQFPFASFKLKFAKSWTTYHRTSVDTTTSSKLMAYILIRKAIDEALSSSAIKASFRNTGLWPFQKDLVIERVAKFLVEDEDPGPTLDEQLVARSESMIKVALGPAVTKPKRKVKTSISVNTPYTGSALIEMAEKEAEEKANAAAEKKAAKLEQAKKKEERAAMKRKRQEDLKEERARKKQKKLDEQAAKEAERESKKCNDCESVHRGSSKWVVCESCTDFRLCPSCFVANREALRDHREENHGQ